MIVSWLSGHLAVGGLLALLFVPPEDLGRGFHRFAGLVASLLLVVALAGGALRGAVGWGLVAASAGWVLLVHRGPVAWFRPSLGALCVLGLAGLIRATPYLPRSPVLEVSDAAVTANALAAALLLGTVTLAMLLGHWYLVIPGLDVRYLRRLTRLLAIGLILRGLLAAVGIGLASPAAGTGETTAWKVAGIGAAFFFWQRVGIGLVAPAVLTLMVDRTIRIKSTQSATGLLYVAVIFVLIGEMISRYLFVAVGIPQ